MELEIPMVAKIKGSVNACLEIDSFIDGSIKIWSSDKDKDGDPEINCKIDLPGEAFDLEFAVEIPVATVLHKGPAALASILLEKGPDFPFKSLVVKAVKQILAAIGGDA